MPNPILVFIIVIFVFLLRYFIIAGGAYSLFYVIFPNKFKALRIQAKFPKPTDYQREIFYSIITTFIFASVALFTSYVLKPYTQFYSNINEYGWGYYLLSIIICIFVHDTYFYWMHRTIHHPKIYRVVHAVHHRSTNPSPWAAFAFHPLEAFFEAGFIFLIAFLVPIHRTAFFLFFLFSTVYNVYGHLGYEIFPKWLVNSQLGKYLNTSVSHNLHHQHVNHNYGLYFRFWDIWMNTVDKDYDKTMQKMQDTRELVKQ